MVKATTGETYSPPPVEFEMENATAALPTGSSSVVFTVAVSVMVLSTPPVLGLILVELAWIEICAAALVGADTAIFKVSLVEGVLTS